MYKMYYPFTSKKNIWMKSFLTGIFYFEVNMLVVGQNILPTSLEMSEALTIPQQTLLNILSCNPWNILSTRFRMVILYEVYD